MTDKEMKIERYREENKTSQKGQTVFTGSSLMEMFPINKLLNEHGNDTIIYNRGIGGFISDELLAVIDVCATDLMPSKVFINIGTNDLSWSTVPISQLMNNYDKIISAIEKAVPDVKIYLMVNNLVQTVFIHFGVLNENVIVDVVFDDFPINLYCAVCFRFRSFPFRRRSRFVLLIRQGI